MKRSDIVRQLTLKITLLTAVFMILGGIIVSIAAVNRIDKLLQPQITAKGTILSKLADDLITMALTLGYPVEKLNGLEQYFKDIRKANPEISYMALTRNNGTTIIIDGDPRSSLQEIASSQNGIVTTRSLMTRECYHTICPVIINGRSEALLFLGVHRSIIWAAIKINILDIITLFVVSLLVIMELMLYLVSRTITAPFSSIYTLISQAKKGNYSYSLRITSSAEVKDFTRYFNVLVKRVNRSFHLLVKHSAAALQTFKSYTFAPHNELKPYTFRSAIEARLPLFLIVFADALSLSFFPLYVQTLFTPVAWISKEVIVGLPISIFMLFWAISLPFAGVWSERKGRDVPFLVGASITAVGLIGTGFSQTIYDLLAWRSLTAVGYGIVYITCQGYVIDSTSKENRTQGMAMFLSSFFAGSLCGSAIGGILAERIGFRSTFFLSSALAVIAAVFVSSRLSKDRPKNVLQNSALTLKNVKMVLSNSRFLAVLLCTAIPGKVCLTGFLYFTVPMFLKSIGTNQSSIGRIIMTYGLSMVILSPLIAKAADRLGNRKFFIIAGGLLAALSLFIIYWVNSIYGILFGTILLGVAHSIGVSSQLTYATDVTVKEAEQIGMGTVIALYRVIERGGNILGPLIAGLFISIFGFTKGIVCIGAITFLGTLVFWAISKFEKQDITEDLLA